MLFTPLDEGHPYSMPVGPFIQRAPGELRPVVDHDPYRAAAFRSGRSDIAASSRADAKSPYGIRFVLQSAIIAPRQVPLSSRIYAPIVARLQLTRDLEYRASGKSPPALSAKVAENGRLHL